MKHDKAARQVIEAPAVTITDVKIKDKVAAVVHQPDAGMGYRGTLLLSRRYFEGHRVPTKCWRR